ncbi:phage minor head protein [uncultured Dialister sp.]|uniref:phage head morphogenesis protein n=1 Tax=uncultured Dialister sp. TaxID=278064 RepID=UPI0026DB4997|nr:phage minor head protein [uncultured Dialister sp.]
MKKYEDRFKPRPSVERRYRAAIRKIMQGLRERLKGAGSPFQMLQILRGFARSPTFNHEAREAAKAMVTHLFYDGASDWREAARHGSRGRMIYETLRKEKDRRNDFDPIIEQNARYITSMASGVADKVSKDMARGYMEGKRPEELMRDVLKRWPELTEWHARLIARTETSKASTALTRVRAEGAGLDWYVWRTSEDARVRTSHHHMDGVICSWSDPPSPEKLVHQKDRGRYNPGEIFNCRCYPEVLLEYGDVSWPHKVYHNGRIQSMTLAAFKRLNGGRDL